MPQSDSLGIRPVLHVVAILVILLGLGMLVPALVDASVGNEDWKGFVLASGATLGFSGGVYLATRGEMRQLTVRQTFLLTTIAWVTMAAFAAIPLSWSSLGLPITDAYFEAMSGLTTTGATVIVGLDNAPPGLLLWRSLLNWFGGIGIIVMAISVLPALRVGGMQLFRTESSDRSERPFSSLRETANAIGLTYLSLTTLSAVAFSAAGMPVFDAICHAMAAISTGGFSTKDASIGAYNSLPIQWVGTFTMAAGALPLTWYARAVRLSSGGSMPVFGDEQVRAFLLVVAVVITVMTLHVWTVVGLDFATALTQSAFNTVSIISNCGLVSTDYTQWGSFAIIVFFFLYFIGGCTGSTSGSIKIFRWQILFKSMSVMMARMVQPHRVLVPTYGGKRVGDDIFESVINLVVVYFVTYALVTIALSFLGLDFVTASSAAAASLSGSGPGLGPIVGPAGTYAPLPDAAKWVLSLTMLLGRLEVFTALILLTPSFWRT